MSQKTAIIIGAGPAGLTAAYEFLKNSDVKPVIYEATDEIGGISKTVNYKGNRIDIGGHRFFSKSDKVMNWWRDIFPIQGAPSCDDIELGRKIPLSTEPNAPDPEQTDKTFLIRKRISRILFLRKFFDYPISLNGKTIGNLWLWKMLKMGISYFKSVIFPLRDEKSLEDFFINRFGKELYETFFKDYTEKVWGVPCDKIPAEWGAQRIKGLSVTKALLDAVKNLGSKEDDSIDQKNTETSLIKQFLYPKHGPGQLWEEVAAQVLEMGGEIHMNSDVKGLKFSDGKIVGVEIVNDAGEKQSATADYYVSTMPVKDLIQAFDNDVPDDVKKTASELMYRDFMTVGLLLNRLEAKNDTAEKTINGIVPDNWIYVQERDVKVGRIQVFNNWSPYMVKDKSKAWIGLEYFCYEGDELWNMEDGDLIEFAKDEMAKINFIKKEDVVDGVVIRVPKTYPAYFGSYENFDVVKNFVNKIDNLFLIGRNGMHKYNNMDHSMLSAMVVVENIKNGVTSKDNIWTVNTESSYHESK